MISKSRWLFAVLSGSSILACSANDSAPNQSTPTSEDAGGGSAGTNIASGGASGAGTGGTTSVGTGGASVVIDAGADVPLSCGSVELEFEVTRGNVLVLFDQSNSMKNEWENGLPRWQVAKESLEAALQPFQKVLEVGALFFPSSVGSGIIIGGQANCPSGWVEPITQPPQIPLEDANLFLTHFAAHFGPAFSTINTTPLPVVLDYANQALPDPSPLPGERIVVLVTDGKETCGTSKLLAPVDALFQRGILTYVIGLPGSDSGIETLNQLATHGGTGAPLTPSDSTALKDALASVVTSTIDECKLTFDPPPPALDDVHLIVTDSTTPGGYEIDPSSGWELAPDGKSATLTGEVCEKVKTKQFDSVKFIFGCPESVIP